MGQANTVRYRILRILEDEGVQGWGDIRVNPKLNKFDPDTLQFELSVLVRTGLVLDVGRGYKLSSAGERHLVSKTANTEGTDNG